MAKKKRAARKKKATRKKRSREWSKVTFEQLDSWREARKIPKKKMAEMLGVTNSTYHNWARGIAVATPNTQERILRVISNSNGNGIHPTPATGAMAQAQTRPGLSPDVMAATGQIVGSYLETRPNGMTPDKLVQLVRDIRQALVS